MNTEVTYNLNIDLVLSKDAVLKELLKISQVVGIEVSWGRWTLSDEYQELAEGAVHNWSEALEVASGYYNNFLHLQVQINNLKEDKYNQIMKRIEEEK